jgi:hypothetical protein
VKEGFDMRTAIIVVAIAGSIVTLGAAGVLAWRAQPGRNRVSPHESVSETVRGARITIVYGRPSMRGRRIFGSLVPYGRVWCPGADEATTLGSSRVLRIGDLEIPTGPHTIWMLPEARRWTLVVSTEPEGFHTQYSPSLDMGRVPLRVRVLDAPVEQLTFSIAPSPAGGGTLAMSWEKTEVSVAFAVK